MQLISLMKLKVNIFTVKISVILSYLFNQKVILPSSLTLIVTVGDRMLQGVVFAAVDMNAQTSGEIFQIISKFLLTITF